MDVRTYALSDFAFGPIMFRTASMLVPQESTFDITDYDGIIGRDVMSLYQIWLDYQDHRAFLKSEAPSLSSNPSVRISRAA